MEGKIVSSQLGEFSKRQIVYGYIGLELPGGQHVKIKVDSYTWYETLTVGDEVIVETETLANTDIVVARKIRLKSNIEPSDEKIEATA